MGFMLINAAFRAMRHVHRGFEVLGLEPPHHAVLMILDTGGPQSQKAIAESLNIDRTTMVHLLDQLEARELVRRDRDPKDRRAHAVYLTDPGSALLAAANAALRRADADYLTPLSGEEQQQLRNFLIRLTTAPPSAAETEPGASAPPPVGPER
jgi:DNA-binding MarR family transcriptional regulator